MPKKTLTLTSKLLIGLLALNEARSFLFPSVRELRKRAFFGDWKSHNSFKTTLYRLHKNGFIRFEDKNNKKFIKLTRHGELEALVAKVVMPFKGKWDGKWRIFMFDIPEDSHRKRDALRGLLKRAGYKQLQASVFVSPYPLNREAVRYLKEKGLSRYIRIIKAEEIDDDRDLRKKFELY